MAGDMYLVAEITKKSVTALDLAPGKNVYAEVNYVAFVQPAADSMDWRYRRTDRVIHRKYGYRQSSLVKLRSDSSLWIRFDGRIQSRMTGAIL